MLLVEKFLLIVLGSQMWTFLSYILISPAIINIEIKRNILEKKISLSDKTLLEFIDVKNLIKVGYLFNTSDRFVNYLLG